MMKKIWTFLFTIVVSMNQLYAISCEVNCELMDKVVTKSQDHSCCPKSEDKKEDDTGCPGHELFGKCYHEEIGFNLDKEIVKSLKDIEATFVISFTELQSQVSPVLLREESKLEVYCFRNILQNEDE